MSSKIEIEKNCEYCGSNYTARTLYTRYCSHQCNSRAYKAIKRQEKITEHLKKDTQTKASTIVPAPSTSEIGVKEFLSISEACVFLGVSRNTLFRWIKSNLLTTYQHSTKHLIKRDDINKIFSNGKE